MLDRLHHEIEELRASRARLASAADAERRAIERALHEGVQQDLVGLAAHLEIVAGSLESDPTGSRALLNELQRETRRALTEVQELAARIFPPLLLAGGLVAELRAAAGRAGVPTQLAVAPDATSSPEVAGAVYFCALDVFQLAPHGTPVAVSAEADGGTVDFEIVAECNLGEERRAPHDRVEALGGRVTITSEGVRTIVTGTLPVP
jgi:signal transduction histidine kinase